MKDQTRSPRRQHSLRSQAMKDQKRLIDFTDRVVDVLDDVVKSRNILLPKTLRSSAEKAWIELKPKSTQLIRTRIRKTTPLELEEHGLTGDPLDFKLRGFLDSYDELDENGGLKRFKRMVKWAKIILGSLKGLIPGLEALLEFLEAVERGIENAEES